ncbi:hypothetical protein EJ065_4980 [Corallococcus coralloides]|uniref:Sacsin/Nov domain-containing protein n=1 Tax=Corallococcus coralloides TaxID=184914 RepID=A0A410RXB0_CORCK|nr:hypothetical protein [Corallococcus coralloides]QAT86520.1 hypothetical protein EJ065_4980 [Corallococcus coralloides]
MAPSNYAAIGDENRTRYGTDIGRIGPMLLADRYDDRTHFIFELLQNAEDALGRRGETGGPRSVTFTLSPGRLKLSHFGRPFDEADVRGVCGIAQSTKDQHSIGRFGIGFKSVYTFTDRPEIHSGDEDFAVENYVQSKAVAPSARAAGETQIILPLKAGDSSAEQEIANGFQHLGPGALLFLRHIDEINWSIEGGASGVYMRSAPETLAANVHRIKVIGQETGKPEVDQNWLVFHREVSSNAGEKVGRVEIAFSLTPSKGEPERWAIQQLSASHLVVFFPTVVATNLGFLVQGPYRTTPSRDNVPRNDPWNQQLVQETADLLVEAVRWLRDNGMLDASALLCLPTDRAKFPEGAMFTLLFEAVREAFLEEALLPRFDGGHVTAAQARLARTQELRELFSAAQLQELFDAEGCAWLTGDITQDRAPELRAYLLRELQVPEITPDKIVVKLGKAFLEAQPDDWLTRLYTFLGGQKAIAGLFSVLPLVRLDDGSHVIARENAKSNAFLPSKIETSFPTVRRAACATSEARSFLISLGLTEPDPVDDVVWNVLPRYRASEVDGDGKAYAADIERIRLAFNTDSKAQREKLLKELGETPFVMVVDAGDGKDYVSKPSEVYVATDRLKALFAGVSGVFVVDDNYECLRGEAVRELLEACGALRYPRPVHTPNALTWEERRELRRQTGQEQLGQYEDVKDWELLGFEALLALLPTLSQEQRAERARLLWEALGDLEERRGRGVFDGSYSWTYYGQRKAPPFPAAFLRRLAKTAWVPDASGDLVRPSLVTFESLGWKPNPFLLSKLAFKPPIIDQLAKEAGIEPAALDLLRKLGITSVADLARIGIANKPPASPPDEAATDDDETADDGAELQAVEVDEDALDDADDAAQALSPDAAAPSEDNDAPDLSVADPDEPTENDTNDESSGAEPTEPRTNGARGPRSTGGEHCPSGAARPGQRNITGQAGLDEQAKRLGRRVASFFDGTAPDADDEEATAGSTVAWQTKLVCLDVAAGGLQLEIGPLDGLPPFVKKLRVIGNEDWDAFVLATNAKVRPTRVSVLPGTGPWRWVAVGFEDEQDLGLDQLALGALDVTTPSVFRVDADGVGQLVTSTTLSLGQSYRLLLPPNFGGEVGTPLADGWRVWSLDLAVQLAPSTGDTLKALGIDVGEASPRLEWALAPASAWRTNARGDSYPVFDEGTELLVNVNGVALEDGDEAMLFLHGPARTERLALSTSGLVSLGKPAAGRWACALRHSRTKVQTATLVFEVAQSVTEYVSAAWTTSVPHGLASLEATAPPGWPVSVRWGGLAAHEETIATAYGNDDRTVSFEDVHPLLEARAARVSVADLVVDFRELGRRLIPLDGRASLEEVRAQLTALWQQRAERVQSLKGMWLQLMPMWFEPTTTRLGYGVDSLAIPDGADAPHGLAAWLLTIDERTNGSITRSPSRLLVLTTDVDSVLRDMREWIDNACTAARVRDAIVTDGTRWATHRKGDRQLRRREWSFDHAINLGSVDDMLNDLTEGL